jgi:hypothetical protein
MQQNVGGLDRILRVILGLVLLGLIFIGPKTWWGLVGLVPLATAVAGFCPAYLPFGFHTCKKAG